MPVFSRYDPRDGPGLAAAHGGTLLFEAVIAALFWLVMAFLNRSARGDVPRAFSAALFLMGTKLSWLYLHEANSAGTRVITVTIWLVGLAAVTLLFRDELSGLLRAALRRTRISA